MRAWLEIVIVRKVLLIDLICPGKKFKIQSTK